ncbi:MAG: DDE domain-containing protein, partial [Promethearchaeota archaeon]
MSIAVKQNQTPIKVIHANLTDFSPELDAYCILLEKKLENTEFSDISSDSEDEFVLFPGRLIRLKNEVCKHHKIQLTKNGTNDRTIYTSEGKSYKNVKLQRYRCKKCGAYKPDYGDFIPGHDNYQEEVKVKARHYYYLGNTPGEVRDLFRVNGTCVPSESSIRNWVKEAAEPIRDVVVNTKLPVSGYFGFDEIHARTNGERTYIFSLVDLWDGFYVNAQFSPDRDAGSIKRFFSSSKRKGKIKFKGLVLDGSNTYGGIFKSWRFSYIKVQRCQTHYKKNLNEAIYEAAGLGMKVKEELPEPYDEIKKVLFAVFNRSTLYRAVWQLLMAEVKLYGKGSEKVDKIIDQFYTLFPNLFRYLEDTRLQPTNNATERMNLDLERYPSLKNGMKTGEGVNIVVNGIVFLHNFKAFQNYILKTEAKICKLDQNIAEFPEDGELIRLKQGLRIHLSWVRKYYANYKGVYLQYFKLRHQIFIVE